MGNVMIHFNVKLLDRSRTYYLALSGGVDSMVVWDFLVRGGWSVKPFHVNHGTKYGLSTAEALNNFFNGKLPIYNVEDWLPNIDTSQEHTWALARNNIYDSLHYPVITAHHLDDAMETWMYSSMCGESKLIPWCSKNVVRPFLRARKADFREWAHKHSVPYWEDPTNGSIEGHGVRNQIRSQLMPVVLSIQPGLAKVLSKKYERS